MGPKNEQVQLDWISRPTLMKMITKVASIVNNKIKSAQVLSSTVAEVLAALAALASSTGEFSISCGACSFVDSSELFDFEFGRAVDLMAFIVSAVI